MGDRLVRVGTVVAAWALVGGVEAGAGLIRGAGWGALGVALAWVAIGCVLARLGRRWPRVASPWAPPLACVLGAALIVVDVRGVALVLAGAGALALLWLGTRALEGWVGVLVAAPAALLGLHVRDALPDRAEARRFVAEVTPVTKRHLPPPGSPDILLLTVDTLRADATGPTFAALARRGLSGPTWAPAPWTLPSLASLHTGLTPYAHGAIVRPPVGGKTRIEGFDAPTLAEALRAAGWRTAAFVENPQVTRARGFARGFDVWDSPDDRDPPRSLLLDGLGLGLDGEPLARHGRNPDARVDRALAWLAEDDRPAFVWVHLLGPHLPWHHADTAPGTALGDALGPGNATRLNLDHLRRGSLRLTPTLRAELRAAYTNEARLADAALGRLVAAAPDAVVVYTADHGEALGEHGGWEHGHALWEEVVRVPLAIAGPGVTPGTFGAASLVDVRGTILAVMGLPGDGVDLRSAPADRYVVLADTLYWEEREGVVRWPWKLTRTLEGDEVQLYDLAADPGERTSVTEANPEIVTRLSQVLDAERARLGETPTGSMGERVRALGYVE